MTDAEFEVWAQSPERNKYQKVVMAWLQKAETGDFPSIREVLDRLIGKVPVPTVNTNINRNAEDDINYDSLTDDQLDALEKAHGELLLGMITGPPS